MTIEYLWYAMLGFADINPYEPYGVIQVADELEATQFVESLRSQGVRRVLVHPIFHREPYVEEQDRNRFTVLFQWH